MTRGAGGWGDVPFTGTASTSGVSRDVQPIIQGAVEEPDRLGNFEEMGILPQGETRPSVKERDRVIEQITDAEAQQRLTPEQGQARREAVLRVERRSDFRHLTRDLPPAAPMPGTDNIRSNPAHLAGIGLFQFFAGMLFYVTALVVPIRPAWAEALLAITGMLVWATGAGMTSYAMSRLRK